ncbi:unnamed protein product [Trichobilharzia regenti]|nr:unnamed protein product [Trichobilharzia regenti]
MLPPFMPQAAFLPHDPNSFYCTHDTPLINEIFGEYVQEQIVKSDLSSCSEYKKLCMICLNHTNENNKQTDSRCYVQDNKLEKFPVQIAQHEILSHFYMEAKNTQITTCDVHVSSEEMWYVMSCTYLTGIY